MAVVDLDTKKDSPLALIEASRLPSAVFNYFDWSKQAFCLGSQVKVFFTFSNQNAAKTVCGFCKVKDECLIWALMYKEEGVWGGTTEKERKDRKVFPEPYITALKSRAQQLNLYFPKRNAREVFDELVDYLKAG